MTNYLIRGFTKTGIYSVEIESDKPMEDVFKMGKNQILDMKPLSPIRSWCIDREQ